MLRGRPFLVSLRKASLLSKSMCFHSRLRISPWRAPVPVSCRDPGAAPFGILWIDLDGRQHYNPKEGAVRNESRSPDAWTAVRNPRCIRPTDAVAGGDPSPIVARPTGPRGERPLRHTHYAWISVAVSMTTCGSLSRAAVMNRLNPLHSPRPHRACAVQATDPSSTKNSIASRMLCFVSCSVDPVVIHPGRSGT